MQFINENIDLIKYAMEYDFNRFFNYAKQHIIKEILMKEFLNFIQKNNFSMPKNKNYSL